MEIPRGKLIPIGGNEAKKEEGQRETGQVPDFENGILREILNEIKNPAPVIEIIPAATEKKEEMAREYIDAFSRLGVKPGIIYANEKSELDSPEILRRLRKADCIFISGGDQDTLLAVLEGTEFIRTAKRKYIEEDFIIAGTSAGAMIMSEYLIDDGQNEEAVLKGTINLSEGLELIPGIIIDTHFLQRGRLSRLIEALLIKRDCTGIGICEDTGVIISEGNEIRAIGSGTVTIIEMYQMGRTNYDIAENSDPVFVENLRVHFLARGARYLLKEKQFAVLEESLAESESGI